MGASAIFPKFFKIQRFRVMSEKQQKYKIKTKSELQLKWLLWWLKTLVQAHAHKNNKHFSIFLITSIPGKNK